MSLPKHIIENYQRFVDAGERTWQDIADQADKDGATSLAKYARDRADHAEEPTFDGGENADDEAPTYEALKVADLKALVAERGITVKPGAVKNDYVDALTASDAAADTDAAKDPAESTDAGATQPAQS